MATRLRGYAILAVCAPATMALADTTAQPPMNSLDFAYYVCDAGAFEIDYDSDTPTHATIITSNHNQRFELNRAAATNGVQFAGGGVKFWTDGKKVLVEGVQPPLQNCRLKGA